MSDPGSLGAGKMDLRYGVDIAMSFGNCHLIFTVQNHAEENAAVLGVFWVVFGC